MVNSIDLFHVYDTDMLSSTSTESAKIFMRQSCCEQLFVWKKVFWGKYNMEKEKGRNMIHDTWFLWKKKNVGFYALI